MLEQYLAYSNHSNILKKFYHLSHFVLPLVFAFESILYETATFN